MLKGLTSAALAAALLAAPVAAQETTSPTLTVTGEGTASAVPEIATVRAGVESGAANAAAALEANNEATERVIEAIKAAGVAARDIQTANFSVQPRYGESRVQLNEEPEVVGYRVTNEVIVTLRDLDEMGSLLDRLVQVGANRINDVSFGFGRAKEEALMDQARKNAVQDARQKAELYAQAAGVELQGIASIDDGGIIRPMPAQHMRLAAASEAVPVERGESTVQANVIIVWEIGVAAGSQ